MGLDKPTAADHELVLRAIDADLLARGLDSEDSSVLAPEGYELIRLLGRGGAGEVYLAEERNLRRRVALKFIGHSRPVDVERFRREARFAARLEDTGIVQIYELGEWMGRPYISMQYIDGGNLGQAELSPQSLVEVIRAVSASLGHAHRQGIVHRDIKPQNILVDLQGRPYLTDFGVARDLRAEFGQTLSGDGIIVGTPELMPPEQARGDQRAIDARSDLYSVGATMYTLLTGQLPFERDNLVDTLHAVIHDDPPFPRAIVGTIPRNLEAIVLRCMKKEKKERYQSIDDLVEDLDDFLRGSSVRTESSAWFRKLVGVKARARPASTADPEVPHWNMAMEVSREISAWDANLYRVASNLPKTYPQLRAIVARLEDLLQHHPDLAWARFFRGMARYRLGELDPALDDMERSIDRIGDLSGSYFELGRLYLSLHLCESLDAYKHISRLGVSSQLDTAKRRLEQAVLMFEEAQRLRGSLPAWQIDFAKAATRLANRDYEECVQICDEILEEDRDLEEVWKLRGDALRFAGEDPIESYEKAVEIRRSYFAAHLAKGEVLFCKRRIEEARKSFERVLEIIPNCSDAMTWVGRTFLVSAREGGGPDSVAAGLKVVKRALESNPDHFEGTVTHAELHMELGKSLRTPESFDLAISELGRCQLLTGCQNRVQMLRARALLEKARLDPDRARAAEELTRLVGLSEEKLAAIPDAEPWREIHEEARALLQG